MFVVYRMLNVLPALSDASGETCDSEGWNEPMFVLYCPLQGGCLRLPNAAGADACDSRKDKARLPVLRRPTER
jgi:hypothetical protein